MRVVDVRDAGLREAAEKAKRLIEFGEFQEAWKLLDATLARGEPGEGSKGGKE